jgi:hypothetical protein
MKCERVGLVSVLAARAPKVRTMFLDQGRRSVNARSAKLTQPTHREEREEQETHGARSMCAGEPEFVKGRGADEIGTRTRSSSSIRQSPSA